MLLEDELVAPEVHAAAHHLRERETAGAREIENLLRRRHFIRIANRQLSFSSICITHQVPMAYTHNRARAEARRTGVAGIAVAGIADDAFA